MTLTINTDASINWQKQIGGYAFWIRHGDTDIRASGRIVHAKTPDDAEIEAVIQAVFSVLSSPIAGISEMVIVGDNHGAMVRIQQKYHYKDIQAKVASIAIKKAMKRLKIPMCTFMHVKAHTDNENEHSVWNRWCDEEARSVMRHHTRQSAACKGAAVSLKTVTKTITTNKPEHMELTLITTELSPIEQGLAKLKTEYSGLKIASIDDKEGYEKVYNGIQVLTKTRTSLDDAKKKLKEQTIAWNKKVDSEYNRIWDAIKAIETPLRDERARVDAEIEAEKERKKNADLIVLQNRIEQCMEQGMTLSEGKYILGTIAVTSEAIRKADDVKFVQFIEKVKSEKRILDEAAEAKRMADEEAAEELKRQQEEVAAQKAALDKQAEEQAKHQEVIESAQGIVEKELNRMADDVKQDAPEHIQTMGRMARTVTTMPLAGTKVDGVPEATDRERLTEFAKFLTDFGPSSVPIVTEAWAVAIANKMKEQFQKMADYVLKNMPQ